MKPLPPMDLGASMVKAKWIREPNIRDKPAILQITVDESAVVEKSSEAEAWAVRECKLRLDDFVKTEAPLCSDCRKYGVEWRCDYDYLRASKVVQMRSQCSNKDDAPCAAIYTQYETEPLKIDKLAKAKDDREEILTYRGKPIQKSDDALDAFRYMNSTHMETNIQENKDKPKTQGDCW